MKKKKQETRVLYVIFDANNNVSVIKYLSKVENLTSILKTTLSKHFSKYKEPYKNNQYTVHKCINVDLKGYFKNNFR
jgi:hypothetical protein